MLIIVVVVVMVILSQTCNLRLTRKGIDERLDKENFKPKIVKSSINLDSSRNIISWILCNKTCGFLNYATTRKQTYFLLHISVANFDTLPTTVCLPRTSSVRKQKLITCLSRSGVFGGRLLEVHFPKVISVPWHSFLHWTYSFRRCAIQYKSSVTTLTISKGHQHK